MITLEKSLIEWNGKQIKIFSSFSVCHFSEIMRLTLCKIKIVSLTFIILNFDTWECEDLKPRQLSEGHITQNRKSSIYTIFLRLPIIFFLFLGFTWSEAKKNWISSNMAICVTWLNRFCYCFCVEYILL